MLYDNPNKLFSEKMRLTTINVFILSDIIGDIYYVNFNFVKLLDISICFSFLKM